MTDDDATSEEPWLEVVYSRAGLKAGFDNTVDVVIAITAPMTLRDGSRGAVMASWGDSDPPPDDFERVLAHRATLALDKIDLDVTPRSGVTIEAPAWLPREGRGWRLPDLPWGAEFQVGLRFHVSAAALPEIGDTKLLGRVRLMAHWVSDWMMLRMGTTIDLPVLSAEEYDATPEDEPVSDFVQQVLDGNAAICSSLTDPGASSPSGEDARG